MNFLTKLFLKSNDDQKQNIVSKKEIKNFIFKNYEQSIAYFRNFFNDTADLSIHEMSILDLQGAIVTMDGMINKELITTSIIIPIELANGFHGTPNEKYEFLKTKVIASSDQVQISTYEDAFKLIMSGFALIIIDGCDRILGIGVQGFGFRGISEPSSEVMQKGSREGFIETLKTNMTMVRRRMKTNKLKFENMQVGTTSHTDICLCYLTDKVSQKILNELKDRISNINLKSLISAEYMIPYLESNEFSLFTSIGISERPDTVCGKISEGRIAILIDGVPTALIVPYLFVEYFHHLDDYAVRPYFASFIRCLKFISFFIAILLPGMYVAIGTFNPEIFPNELLNKVVSSIGTTPFSLFMETLLIHFVYEIMREAGLRLPKPLGHAVSIVGSLVIGNAAVEAGLIGSPTLMVVALTAIASYVIPNLYEAIEILRFAFILIGGLVGLWGISILFCVVLINVCSKENFGIPFTTPLSPFGMFSMRDVLMRAGWKTLSKKGNSIQKMPGADLGRERF